MEADVLTQYYTELAPQTNDLKGFSFYSQVVEERYLKMKALESALFFTGMANSKKKEELEKLPLIKDDIVEYWLNSDSDLENVISAISENIMASADEFGTKIEQIKMTEAFKGHPYEEIEVEIKVPEEMDIDKVDDFWDHVGVNAGKIIAKEGLSETKIKEIKQRILIVVTQ